MRRAQHRLCPCEPEGRRREDDDGRQPRRLPRRRRRAGARRRPRPAGECDVGPRRAGERYVELRPARRRATRLAGEADAVREPPPRAFPARAGGRRRGALAARGRGALSRTGAEWPHLALLVRLRRLPTLSGAADGERARRGRRRARTRAGRVLRPRGPRATARLGRLVADASTRASPLQESC